MALPVQFWLPQKVLWWRELDSNSRHPWTLRESVAWLVPHFGQIKVTVLWPPLLLGKGVQYLWIPSTFKKGTASLKACSSFFLFSSKCLWNGRWPIILMMLFLSNTSKKVINTLNFCYDFYFISLFMIRIIIIRYHCLTLFHWAI